jgi:hypothetical protein
MKYLSGYTDPFISPVTGLSSINQPLPDLERGYVWMGDENSRPLPTFKLIDLTIDVKFLQKQLDVLLQTTFVVNTPVPSLPKAQALSALNDGLIKNVSGVLAIATSNVDYLTPTLASGNLWIGNNANIATPQPTIAVANLPNLKQGTVWQGDANNRPVEVTIAVAPVDARYILQQPNSSLTNAQSLNQLVGIQPKILKAGDDGVIAVAIPDQDYATKETLEQIKAETEEFKAQAQAAAEEAAVSAEEASASALEATAAATEATGAAATASGAATAAGASALGAGASAIAAGLSAGSASSSASDASSSADYAATSATNAQASAVSAADSLNTLLHTGITLQGAIYGSGGLLNPITTNFSNNPVLPGSEAMTIPKGTNTQRPATPIAGMVRYNNGAA